MSGIEAAFFGTLGRDAEVRTSRGGKEYLTFSVRVGEGEAARWINVRAFDPQAIAAVDKMVKGARVYVEGSLRLDEWTAADGTKRTGLSVISEHSAKIAAKAPSHPPSVIAAEHRHARANGALLWGRARPRNEL